MSVVLVILRSLGGITWKLIEQGVPEAGVAVTEQDTGLADAGDTQPPLVPVALMVPAVADHVDGADAVIITISLTPTTVRVSAVPSGAASNVCELIVHGGPAGAAGGGAGGEGTRRVDFGGLASVCEVGRAVSFRADVSAIGCSPRTAASPKRDPDAAPDVAPAGAGAGPGD
jgi:hypothetical protein